MRYLFLFYIDRRPGSVIPNISQPFLLFLSLRFQDGHIPLRPCHKKAVTLAELKEEIAVFKTLCHAFKFLEFNSMQVPVLYLLGIHKNRKWLIRVNVGNLRENRDLMVWVQIQPAQHYLCRLSIS